MNSLAKVIAKSGILSTEQVDEFRRWKTPGVIDLDGSEPTADSAEAIVEGIEQALQSKELVLVRATDLNILPQFLKTQAQGKLRVTSGSEEADFDIVFGRTTMGEYILPFMNDIVEEVLTNGEAKLVVGSSDPVHFTSINPLYFGEVKAFLLCTASP